MNLDLRVPMGLLFLIVGLILTGLGAVTHGNAMYARSTGVDINLVWGLVMLVFGSTMLWLGRRSDARLAAKPVEGTTKPLGRSGHGGH